MNKSLRDDLLSWVKAINLRGTFGRRNQKDRALVEVSTVNEWAIAVMSEFGLHISDVSPCQNDPPDCFATLDGKTISIELAELIDSNRIEENVAAIEAGNEPPHYNGEGFDKTQWSRDRFFTELTSLMNKKQTKYQGNGLSFDVLIIHTDETWLFPQQVNEWLSLQRIEPINSFKSAYLLMNYTPGYSDHWPLFRLFG